MIYLRDVRAPSHFTSRLEGHKQEVCGLKWSFDNMSLASGGNDNKVRADKRYHVAVTSCRGEWTRVALCRSC
jgi:WD40 repeat protein